MTTEAKLETLFILFWFLYADQKSFERSGSSPMSHWEWSSGFVGVIYTFFSFFDDRNSYTFTDLTIVEEMMTKSTQKIVSAASTSSVSATSARPTA